MNTPHKIPAWVGNAHKPYSLSEFESWHIEQFGCEPNFSFIDYETDDRLLREAYITINGVEYSAAGSSYYKTKMHTIRKVAVGLGYSDGNSHPYMVQEKSAIEQYNDKMMSFLNTEVNRFATLLN